MKRSLASRAVPVATIALGLLLGAAARADDGVPYDGALEILTRDWDAKAPDAPPTFTSAYASPDAIGKALRDAWASERPDLEKRIKDFASTPGAVAKDQKLYDVSCSLPADGALRVVGTNPLTLVYDLRGAKLDFTVDVTALPDPSFTMHFDLLCTVDLTIPPLVQPLKATAAVARARNASLEPRGLAAQAATAIAGVLKTLGLANIIGGVEASFNSQQVDILDDINAAMKPLNLLMAVMKDKGYFMLDGGFDPGSRKLTLAMTRSVNVMTTGPGVIAGVIQWSKSLGEPQPDTTRPGGRPGGPQLARPPIALARGPFEVQVTMQVGPKGPEDLSGPIQQVGRAKVDAQVLNGETYQCSYTVENLPLGIPLLLTARGTAVAWSGEAGAKQRLLVPSGWDGRVTIKPAPKFAATTIRPLLPARVQLVATGPVAVGPLPTGSAPPDRVNLPVAGGASVAVARLWHNPSAPLKVEPLIFEMRLTDRVR